MGDAAPDGYLPEWYLLITAARYLNVPPWELLHQPEVWFHWALDARNAEIIAENERMKKK